MRIQGRGPERPPPRLLLFLDQTEARRAEKNFLGRPGPFYAVFQGLDPALVRSNLFAENESY